MSDLQAVDFRQTLVWAHYHEPLGHESIYSNIAMARKLSPLAFLALHTNADLLTHEALKLLADAGLDQVRINLYLVNDERFTEQSVASLVGRLERRGRLKAQVGGDGRLVLAGSPLDAPIYVPNISTGDYSSRGGSLPDAKVVYRRTSACLSPLQHVVIDYNGKGVFCCQMRSDVPGREAAIVGDLTVPDYGLFDIYRDLAPERLRLVSPGVKGGGGGRAL